jgi:hypothetical protein
VIVAPRASGSRGPENNRFPRGGRRRHSGRRLVSQVTRLGSGLGAAVLGRRPLTEYEFGPLLVFGLLMLALALIGVKYPMVLAIPVAVFTGSTGLYLAVRAFRLRWWARRRRARQVQPAGPRDVPGRLRS